MYACIYECSVSDANCLSGHVHSWSSVGPQLKSSLTASACISLHGTYTHELHSNLFFYCYPALMSPRPGVQHKYAQIRRSGIRQLKSSPRLPPMVFTLFLISLLHRKQFTSGVRFKLRGNWGMVRDGSHCTVRVWTQAGKRDIFPSFIIPVHECIMN